MVNLHDVTVKTQLSCSVGCVSGNVMLKNYSQPGTSSATITGENRPLIWRKGLYYLQRIVVNRAFRRAVVFALGRWVGASRRTSEKPHPLLHELKEQGVVKLNGALSDSQCAEIVQYLSDKPVYDRKHTIDRAFSQAQPADMAFGIYFPQNVLECPHIMEFVSSPEIVQLAADYLGCAPTLSCLGVQWSFPTNAPRDVQKFHRDSEDWKYLRFLTYLTDVEDGCGPHVYIKGSHRDRLPLRLKFYQADEISQQYGNDRFAQIFGSRGTAIAADTSGIHKGELPTTRPRLILTFTFAILPNPLGNYAPLRTHRGDAFKTRTNRLFVR